jgi:hypothetical protein
MTKATKKLSRTSHCPDWDSNQETPNYESRLLPVHHPAWYDCNDDDDDNDDMNNGEDLLLLINLRQRNGIQRQLFLLLPSPGSHTSAFYIQMSTELLIRSQNW